MVADLNSARVDNIEIGMTRKEVSNTMGTEIFYERFRADTSDPVRNPLVTKTFRLNNGEVLDVAYYFTRYNGLYTSDICHDDPPCCTPFVFKKDVLIGWGENFLDSTVKAGNGLQ